MLLMQQLCSTPESKTKNKYSENIGHRFNSGLTDALWNLHLDHFL